jgi:hypothetical protein
MQAYRGAWRQMTFSPMDGCLATDKATLLLTLIGQGTSPADLLSKVRFAPYCGCKMSCLITGLYYRLCSYSLFSVAHSRSVACLFRTIPPKVKGISDTAESKPPMGASPRWLFCDCSWKKKFRQLKIAFSFDYKLQYGRIDMLHNAMATAQHHDAVTGTEKQHVADDYALRYALSSWTILCNLFM